MKEKEMGKEMNRILTFDCYGTLLDTSPARLAIEQIADRHGLDPKESFALYEKCENEQMYEHDFRPFDALTPEVLRSMDSELGVDVFEKNVDLLWNAYANFQPFEDVLPVLEQLKADGWRLIVLSNTCPQLMERHLKALNGLIDKTLIASQTHCYKPVLSFFEQAEEKFSLDKACHIHIAAGYWWGILPSKKMNWDAIWVSRRPQDNQLEKEQSVPFVHTFADLCGRIQDILHA